MEASSVRLKEIRLNRDNPRSIRKSRFDRLVLSILVFPKMLEIRPIVVDDGMTVLGGNMRLKALRSIAKMTPDAIRKRLGPSADFSALDDDAKNRLIAYWAKWLEAPSAPVIRASELTPEERRQFIIKDNASFGEWDMDALANAWDGHSLTDWGVDLPDEWLSKAQSSSWPADGDGEGDGGDDASDDDDEGDAGYEEARDVIYPSDNELEIPSLLLDGQAGRLEVPFAPWGADSRMRKGIATYHFYVEDYRFSAIWKDPGRVMASGVRAVVEPNLSLFDTTPVAYGLAQIYKKRWISRYFQECGVKVYADLNVARKFYGYNRLGIPKGYDAFATRGYSDRMEYLKAEHQIAREISGKDAPNMIVYGGGDAVREYCAGNGLVYIEQFMQNHGARAKDRDADTEE